MYVYIPQKTRMYSQVFEFFIYWFVILNFFFILNFIFVFIFIKFFIN